MGYWLVGGSATPGVLAELPELTLGEKVNLDLVQDDSQVVDGGGNFDAPQFLAVFVEYSDGFAFPRDETALGAWGFDEKGEALGRGLVGRAHVGSLDRLVKLRLPAGFESWCKIVASVHNFSTQQSQQYFAFVNIGRRNGKQIMIDDDEVSELTNFYRTGFFFLEG